MGAKWSEAEVAVLADVAKTGVTLRSQMHRLPGRTHEAARTYAARIGIPLSAARAWTKEERAILKRIWRSGEQIKIGMRQLPNRSYAAARGEAQRLRICGDRTKRNGYSWVDAAITVLLADGVRMTIKQLTAATGASPNAVDKALNRRRGTKFRVCDWTRVSRNGDWAGVWGLGVGEDAPRPPRKTPSEVAKTWRARRRIAGGAHNPFAGLIQQVAA